MDNSYLIKSDLDNILDSIRQYGIKVLAKCKTDSVTKIDGYVNRINDYIRSRIEIRSHGNDYGLYSSRILDMFICTPVDKASNNIAFICPKFYIQSLDRELGLDRITTQNHTAFYKIIPETVTTIRNNHKLINGKYQLDMVQRSTVPILYGIPKFHKTPIKFRFIAGAANSTIKPLAILLLNILTSVKNHFKNYCTTVETRTNLKCYLSVQNSQEVVKKLNASPGNFTNASTYDFSTLYTKLPHRTVIDELCFLIDMLFRNSGKAYINCCKTKGKYSRKAFYTDDCNTAGDRICLKQSDVKDIIHLIITESYIMYAGKVHSQESGIPMGGNASPLVADLVLSVLEYKYLKRNPMPSSSFLFRYVDDILVVNSDATHMIHNAYPKELDITSEPCVNGTINYLDFTLHTNARRLHVYNKTNVFTFPVVRAYHGTSCVHSGMIIGVIIGNLVRFTRISTNLKDLIDSSKSYINQVEKYGHRVDKIRKAVKKFSHLYSNFLWKYNIFSQKDRTLKFVNKVFEST